MKRLSEYLVSIGGTAGLGALFTQGFTKAEIEDAELLGLIEIAQDLVYLVN